MSESERKARSEKISLALIGSMLLGVTASLMAMEMLSRDEVRQEPAVSAPDVSTPLPPVVHQTITAHAPPPWSVFFSPRGGCTDAAVAEIGRAQKSILVQAYSFTSDDIAEALIDAHARGVRVEVVLDKGQPAAHGSKGDLVRKSGIPVSIDRAHQIAHNKVMVIDGRTVLTGSFNFTTSAEDANAENLLIIHDKDLAATYTRNWNRHRDHAEVWK